MRGRNSFPWYPRKMDGNLERNSQSKVSIKSMFEPKLKEKSIATCMLVS
jgi:hypothetical protein